SEEEKKHWKNDIDELKKGKPVQYVMGYTWFYHLVFMVNEHTLIPRPETEQLAHEIVQQCTTESSKTFLDIGTGSGCIPISIAYHLKKGKFYAVDISAETLEVAKTNAQ